MRSLRDETRNVFDEEGCYVVLLFVLAWRVLVDNVLRWHRALRRDVRLVLLRLGHHCSLMSFVLGGQVGKLMSS